MNDSGYERPTSCGGCGCWLACESAAAACERDATATGDGISACAGGASLVGAAVVAFILPLAILAGAIGWLGGTLGEFTAAVVGFVLAALVVLVTCSRRTAKAATGSATCSTTDTATGTHEAAHGDV